MKRSHPRPLSQAVEGFAAGLSPPTLLASIQAVWESVAGQGIAAEASPVAEAAGVVTVACKSAVWAQELELLSPSLVEAVNSAVAPAAAENPPVRALRFVVSDRRIR